MPATKENTSKIAMAAVSLLILIKVFASIVTGSIAIRADAIHSAIDLIGVIIGYIGIRIAGRPPDERHHFGHGKAENIVGVIIAGFIFAAAVTIFYEAVQRLITGGVVEMVTLGIYVTAGAIAINFITSWYTLRVAKATDSLALEATGRDLLADVWSSVAVLIGLILVGLTGLNILDSIVALLVAGVIARTAFLTLRKSFGGLMDTKLPDDEEEALISCIMEHRTQLVSFHEVRSRKAGNQRFVDLHLVMPKNARVEDAHQLCDHLEQDLEDRLPNSSVTIHVEPCSTECTECLVSSCDLRIDITLNR